ncbi:unnamed protein product [Citrullus colocynthis]|uniref:FMN hydroxy acid dehydrogenase domain-containing protein n=1 Tax=Citrullus colocynthis TaxID=252529 RepID=A0ABP0Z1D0_9ROSI
MYYDYYAGGAEDQHTLRQNMQAFYRITIQPRILVDVSKIDMSTMILGYRISAPIMVAPTGAHKLAYHEGELATARAAAAAKTIMVLSYTSSYSMQEVASSCNAILFFQLRDISTLLVQRAERFGYKAIVLTADTPRLGRREADIKNKMITPPLKNLEGLLSIKVEVDSDKGSLLESFVNEAFAPSLCWKDVAWLKSITSLPILVKGILTHEDDFSPATISVLEEVVHAVKGKVPVLLDGGVRRGTDVFKALAFGAQAVLVGRPIIYGLAAKGEEGVRKVLEC